MRLERRQVIYALLLGAVLIGTSGLASAEKREMTYVKSNSRTSRSPPR